jgi:Domain of unknown function (DUF4214)
LVVSGPGSIQAGTLAGFNVTAYDRYGDVAAGYAGTVHFTSTDSSAVLPANYTFTAADKTVHGFTATLETAGMQAISAADTANSSVAGTSPAIAVAPAAPDHLIFAAVPPTAIVGALLSPAVQVQIVDQFGNLLIGDNADQVTLAVAGGPAGFTPASTTSVTVNSGVATVSNVAFLAGGAYTVSASTTGELTGPGVTVHVARIGPPPSWLPPAANNLTHSTEYYIGIVTAAYQRFLGRAPDTAGLAGWVSQMQHGLTDERLEAYFLSSTEYIRNHGGPGAGWVHGLYQDMLGRTPSQAEVDSWVQTLARGVSTTDVAYGFAASTERERQRVTADYLQYLGRSPGAAEVDGWVAAFESGARTNEDVVAGFIGSTEFFMRHFGNASDWFASAFQALFGQAASQVGTAPSYLAPLAVTLTHSTEYYAGIVTAAYQRFLGRAPDTAGLATWVAQMQGGLTDEHVEADFLGSTEYIQAHGGPGAGWVRGLYHDLLGRDPSQAEVDSWVQTLAHGVSTTDVAYGFAASTERERQRVRADYLQYLGRSASSAEVDGWVAALENGLLTHEDVVARFVGSLEFFQKHQSNPHDWLNQAVLALLGAAGF